MPLREGRYIVFQKPPALAVGRFTVVAVTAVIRGNLSILPGSSQNEDSGFLGLKSPNSLKDIEPTTKEVLRNV